MPKVKIATITAISSATNGSPMKSRTLRARRALVEHDVAEGLAHHQHDGQQHRRERRRRSSGDARASRSTRRTDRRRAPAPTCRRTARRPVRRRRSSGSRRGCRAPASDRGWRRPASIAASGPGCGGTKPCIADRPASAGMPSEMIDLSARLATRKMTGISRTRPISKNIGRPMIAPIAAIDHGSIRGLDRPTIVSTIWSAPPESASSLPNIAPSAISTPTPATVLADARAEAGDDVEHLASGDRADRERAEDQRQERVQLEVGDRDDQHRDADQGRGDELPGAGDGLDRLGGRR